MGQEEYESVLNNRINDANYQQYNVIQKPVAEIMTTGAWVKTLLLLSIPGINVILVLVWAFSESVNPNKRNLMKAALLMIVLIPVLVLAMIVVSPFFVAIWAIISS